MTITITVPGGPLVIGPGAPISATSDLLGLSNGPYSWHFEYTGPDNTFHFTQDVTTDFPEEPAGHILLWSTTELPSDLLAAIHARLNDTIKVQVTVRDVDALVVDTSPVVNVQWDPVAWANFNTRLWTNNLVSRIGDSGGGDKLDRILAAVYRTFPHG